MHTPFPPQNMSLLGQTDPFSCPLPGGKTVLRSSQGIGTFPPDTFNISNKNKTGWEAACAKKSNIETQTDTAHAQDCESVYIDEYTLTIREAANAKRTHLVFHS